MLHSSDAQFVVGTAAGIHPVIAQRPWTTQGLSAVCHATAGELSSCRSIVVYTGTRFAADALAAQLQRAAVAARPYHAGMRQQQRELVQVCACME